MATELDLRGNLDEKFVAIHGVDAAIEVLDCQGNFVGEAVDPNGRSGWAHWDAEGEQYLVDTLDGVLVAVPEANLQESSFVSPEAGGYDLTWPSLSLSRIGTSFGMKVADTLRRQGYCVIDTPAVMKDSFKPTFHNGQASLRHTRPPSEFAEIYLGSDTNCGIAWLDEAPPPYDPKGEYVSPWCQNLETVTSLLAPLTHVFLGFRPAAYHGGTFLRSPHSNRRAAESSMVPPLTEDDIASGAVEMHLDFARRRRICMMHFGHSTEIVELQSKADPSATPLHLPMRDGRLLLFRHDILSYCYAPRNGSEILFQTWILEEPTQLEISGLQGSQRSLDALLGGPSLNVERQVHIMNAICRFPGGAYKMERDWCAYSKQTDTFIEIPLVRFDIDLYWEPAGQFNSTGKSSTKHAGLLGDNELVNFDNTYFGFSGKVAENIPCIQRVLLELTSELFTMVGVKQDGAGKKIYTSLGEVGIEWDPFYNYQQDPTTWVKSAPMQMLSINRLCHAFNLTGPASGVDTACSASLVAANMGHAYLRSHDNKGVTSALAMGLQHIIYPWPFIGLSGAGMLGSGGRCKTFDQSANGYNRGEGCGGLFSKVSDELDVIQERLACYCGSYINQDGRSASLTAPNGPSQQMVIRGSLKQADIQPEMVNTCENHGTGTAIGDPIETGSLRAVFKRRDENMPVTSGKTHMGHLEAGAGVVGILKNLCSLTHAATPPNCHLRQPNVHCEFDGFPGMFPVEVLDLPHEYHYGGCNGFGFGGTNTRCDMFAHRRSDRNELQDPRRQLIVQPWVFGEAHEHRPLMPQLGKLDMVTVQCARCLGPMCWLCSAVPSASGGKHRCGDVRAEAASYDYCSDCYSGTYLLGGPERTNIGLGSAEPKVFLRGSWSGWESLEPMHPAPGQVGGETVFEGEALLGDVRVEHFYMELHNGPVKKVIQPVSKRASQRIRVAAPTVKLVPNTYWLIDGHRDGVPQNTVYKVRLSWGDAGLSVAWTPAGPAPDDEKFRRKYRIASSLSFFVPTLGSNFSDDRAHWNYQMGRIPAGGKVEFMIVRDEDTSQMIYPVQHNPTEESIPVGGPDDGGDGRRWQLWGKEGERVCIDLRVDDGHISISMKTASMGSLTFSGSTDRSYHIVGSSTRMVPEAMRRDAEVRDVWRHRLRLGQAGREEFQIWANQNSNLRIYPAGGGAPGQDIACGPDRKGLKKFWQVVGLPGELMEIVLDTGAEDNCRMVTCQPCATLEQAALL